MTKRMSNSTDCARLFSCLFEAAVICLFDERPKAELESDDVMLLFTF